MRHLLYAFVLLIGFSGVAQASCGGGFPYTLTNGTNADASQVMANLQHALDCGSLSPTAPQGRLTLISGQPVMSSDVSGATSVFYTPYVGNLVPIYSAASSQTSSYQFNEIAIGLDASVPRMVANNVYDIFITLDNAMPVACMGPAWASATSRGAGLGTTEIRNSVNGFWTNANELTACWGGVSGTTDYGPVSADEATYVGSIYILKTINGQTSMVMNPAPAVAGNSNVLGVWNAYNRIKVTATNSELTPNWINNSGAWRKSINSDGSTITWIDGLQQSSISMINYNTVSMVTSSSATTSIALDDNIAPITNQALAVYPPGIQAELVVTQTLKPLLGKHVVTPIEAASGTVTFYGGGNLDHFTIELEM